MFIFSYTAAILTIVFSVFAALILSYRRDDLLARYLAYYAIGVSLWIGSNAAADVANGDLSLRIWSGLALIGVAVFCGFYLCFVQAFIYRQTPPAWLKAVFFLPAAIIAAGAFTRYSVVETFFPVETPTQIIPGPLYSVVSAYLIASLLYGLVRLVIFYRRRATPIQRLQIKYMETGFLILFLASIITCHILPLFGELRFFTVGPQFSVFLLALSGYAILRHRLLDFKVAVQRSLIFSILLFLIVITYLALLAAVSTLTKRVTGASYLLTSILTAVAGIFGIPPIERAFRRYTDRLFFRNRYDYPEAMEMISRVLNENLDMDDLLDGIRQSLRDIFRAEDITIDLSNGPTEDGPHPIAAAEEGGLTVPIILKGRQVAVVRLGKKMSEEPYYDNDLTLLQSFSFQAAVAIEKARLYRETQEHSRLLESRVRERTGELESLQQAQAEMICDISHNLQTPLTVMKGQLEMMKADRNRYDEAGLRRLEGIADRISSFITRLLRLAALNVPEGLQRDDVDLSGLLREILGYFEVVAQGQGIDIRADIADNVHVLGDRRRLEELILNILGNSAKYIANERRIAISLSDDGGRARLRIDDTGVGIAEGDIAKVFRRFFRGQTDRKDGTGLGLAISRRIVELHGGVITLRSELGRGTTVEITLPENRPAELTNET